MGPEKSEGFDEIRYVWQKAPACDEYLKKWIVERKLTERVEDLQPGQWFKDQLAEWTTVLAEWRRCQTDWQDPKRRQQMAKKKQDDKSKKRKAEELAAKGEAKGDADKSDEAQKKEDVEMKAKENEGD